MVKPGDETSLSSLAEDLKEIRKRSTSNSAKIWEFATKACVPTAIILGSWMVTMDRKVSANSHQIEMVKQTQSDMSMIREKLGEIAERLARVEAKIEN